MKKSLLVFLLVSSFDTAFAQWTTVCGSGNGFVDNFEVFNGEMFATGFFTTVCGTTNGHVVRFDGTNWQAAGTGYPYAGHQLKAIDTTLYFVGYQPTIDSNWVYTWDGSGFNKLGTGVYLTTAVTGFSQTANLYAVESYNNHLVVSGEFDRVGNKQISGIMQWNGAEWDSLGSGLSGNIAGSTSIMYPHDMCVFGTDLVVVGNFLEAGGIPVNGIARWDGTQWHAFGAGFNAVVYGVAVFNGELYAAGEFTQSGSTNLKRIAKWNGSEWVDPGFGVSYQNTAYHSFIHTLKVIENRLFITGGFDKVESASGVVSCQAICAFDGNSILTLGGGIPNREIEAVALFQGELYAGGGMNNSNSFIARYDGYHSLSLQEEEIAMSVAPNPSADGRVRVSSEAPLDKITVYNEMGQEVLLMQSEQTEEILELPVSGYYTLVIQTARGVSHKPVIVSRCF